MGDTLNLQVVISQSVAASRISDSAAHAPAAAAMALNETQQKKLDKKTKKITDPEKLEASQKENEKYRQVKRGYRKIDLFG